MSACWTECPDCGDFFCNIHQEHAADCDCPGIEEWAEFDVFPYTSQVDDPGVIALMAATDDEG